MRGPDVDTRTIVIIDDDPLAGHMLADLIADIVDAERKLFVNPIEALEWLAIHVPDLIVTDFQMPEASGLQVVAAVRRDPRIRDVPIVMLTAVDSPALRLSALEAGATDFIQKPFQRAEISSRVKNMLALREGQIAQARRADGLATEVEQALQELREREREIVLRLSRAAEFRDADTHAHLLRIADYARVIAMELGWSAEEIELLTVAAPMHDVGKIGIPDHIILKTGKLTADEYVEMQTHARIGHAILAGSTSKLLVMAAEIALSHHEHWNGMGYPQGLKGLEIPEAARVVAIADVFDALTTSRPYKEAWPVDDALRFVADRAGTQFDPTIAAAFLAREDEIRSVEETLRDRPAAVASS